VRRC